MIDNNDDRDKRSNFNSLSPPDKGPNTFGINDRGLEVNETAALYFLLLKLSESGLTEVRAIAFQQLMGG